VYAVRAQFFDVGAIARCGSHFDAALFDVIQDGRSLNPSTTGDERSSEDRELGPAGIDLRRVAEHLLKCDFRRCFIPPARLHLERDKNERQ
jgi:hypothetical protein